MATPDLPAEIREALDKIERAERMVSALCEGKRRWTMSVPARPDDDPDLVISDGLAAGRKAIEALVRERDEARKDTERLDWLEEEGAEIGRTDEGDWYAHINDDVISGFLAHPTARDAMDAAMPARNVEGEDG